MADTKIKPQHRQPKASPLLLFPCGLPLLCPCALGVLVALWLAVNFAKQTQFQNGQNDHKYSKHKGLCQRTTNNEQQTLFKTNPIKANFKRKNSLLRLPDERLPRPWSPRNDEGL